MFSKEAESRAERKDRAKRQTTRRQDDNGLKDLSAALFRISPRAPRLSATIGFRSFVVTAGNCLGARAILSAASLALRSPQDDTRGLTAVAVASLQPAPIAS